MVDVVSTFRIRYVVEAREEEHALDEVVMREHDTDFKEFSQEHLGYHICSSQEMTEQKLIEQFDKDNDYLKNWSDKQKLNTINKIVYEDENDSRKE
jgi:hypothetical protein